ncbi:MAG: hypothetical protein QM500_05585 [Methylococcales bacterium]
MYYLNKLKKNKAIVFGSLLAVVSVSNVYAVTTLTFSDNTSPLNPYPSTGYFGTIAISSPPNTVPFAASMEFRMMKLDGDTGGGGEKSLFNGGETWVFNDDVKLSSVTGTEITGGTDDAVSPGSPLPAGGIGLFNNAPFFDAPFGFLAPTTGSAVAATYGESKLSVDTDGGTIQVFFPALEAQWGQTYFPLGLGAEPLRGLGITFSGTLSNIQLNTPTTGQATYDFVMTAEHTIVNSLIQIYAPTAMSEDPYIDPARGINNPNNGFGGWTATWEIHGSAVGAMTVINAPGTSTGSLAASLPGTSRNDGRISQAELNDAALYNASADDGSVSSSKTITDADSPLYDAAGALKTCIGGCFAFTVTGVTGATEQIVIPLSSSIPANAVYRKLIAGAWVNFDDSGVDAIESAPGVIGDCSAATAYTPGLSQGDFCVRLTIADGGPNDDDGTPADLTDADGTIIDPGGIALLNTPAPLCERDPTNEACTITSLDDANGCSISSRPVDPMEKADWFIVAAFIALLGFTRRMRKENT